MARIRVKGVNSEYKWDRWEEEGEEKVGVKAVDSPEELFLKLFICPYHMPSAVEAPWGEKEDEESPFPHEEDKEKRCQGMDEECPVEQDDKSGHALIELNENMGIQLVTGQGYRLILSKDGSLIFRKNEDQVLVKCSEHELLIQQADGLAIEAKEGALSIIRPNEDHQTTLHLTADRLTIETGMGAKLIMDNSGNITLTTKDDVGTVQINGALNVTGTVTAENIPAKEP